MPTKLEPKGARFRYWEMIHCFGFARSILAALTASFHFHQRFFGCGLKRRTACIVIVDAPEMRRLQLTFCHAARRTLIGLTPWCDQNELSSAATSAFTIQSSGEAT